MRLKQMRAKVMRGIRRALILLAVAAVALLALRVYEIQRGPPLARWHTYVPKELKAKQLDASDWNRYLAEEAKIFEGLRSEVTQKLDPDERRPINRYFEGSPI